MITSPITRFKNIEQLWKNSTNILNSNEASIIYKFLKNISNEIKEIKDSKESLTQLEILNIEKKFGGLINNFVRNFDFNRVIDPSQRRSIAKYSYHILVCVINIVDQFESMMDKEYLLKSCQICLNYYFPSKAIKTLENNINFFNPNHNIFLDKFENKTFEDKFIRTPPRNSLKLELNSLPNPSPFQTISRSPKVALNSGNHNVITRYNSVENCLLEYSSFQNIKNDDLYLSDSDFLPKEFQFPLSIEEAKKKLRQKLLKKEILETRNLNKNLDNTTKEIDYLNSPNRSRSLMHSWGSETDKSDLQIEDLTSSNISYKSEKKFNLSQKVQTLDDFWESTKVSAELAETLSEPYRTRRIRNEIYQQSIEKSVELLKNLGICPNLRPNVLLKTMFHTIEEITHYS